MSENTNEPATQETPIVAPKKRGRPPGSKNKAKQKEKTVKPATETTELTDVKGATVKIVIENSAPDLTEAETITTSAE